MSRRQSTDPTTAWSLAYVSSSTEPIQTSNDGSNIADVPHDQFFIFPDVTVGSVITQSRNIYQWLKTDMSQAGTGLSESVPTELTKEMVPKVDLFLCRLLYELRNRFSLPFYTIVCGWSERHVRQEKCYQICAFFRGARWMPFYCLEGRTSCNDWHEPVRNWPWWARECGSELTYGDLGGDLRRIFGFELGQQCVSLVRLLVNISYLRIFLNALGNAVAGDSWCHHLADRLLGLAVQGSNILHMLIHFP
jgi:hypothetical protein